MRQRNTYSKSFKTQIMQECQQPGVSIAGVALSHGINANVVRRWISVDRNTVSQHLPAFIPLKLEPTTQASPETPISIDVPCGKGKLTVRWPNRDPHGCAQFVRELTR